MAEADWESSSSGDSLGNKASDFRWQPHKSRRRGDYISITHSIPMPVVNNPRINQPMKESSRQNNFNLFPYINLLLSLWPRIFLSPDGRPGYKARHNEKINDSGYNEEQRPEQNENIYYDHEAKSFSETFKAVKPP